MSEDKETQIHQKANGATNPDIPQTKSPKNKQQVRLSWLFDLCRVVLHEKNEIASNKILLVGNQLALARIQSSSCLVKQIKCRRSLTTGLVL